MVFTTEVKEETQLYPTVVYSAFVNVADILDVATDQKNFTNALAYISLTRLSVFNMIMQRTERTLMMIANSNRHYEVS